MAPKRPTLFGVPLLQWLAVLPIIAIVAAIIYPVFQKVREPHGPPCRRNMQQLGLALVQYSQDADEAYPPGVNAAGSGWAGQLYPYMYVKSVGVYQCPDDLHDGSYISYAENRNIAGQKLEKFTSPAATVAFYETTTLNCDPSMPEAVSTTGINAPQNSTRHDSPQTPFGLNFAFADGHVKMLTPKQVSGGPNALPPKHKGTYAATFAIK